MNDPRTTYLMVGAGLALFAWLVLVPAAIISGRGRRKSRGERRWRDRG